MSQDLTASVLATRKLKTYLAQAQLKYEYLSDRHVKLEHEYTKLRSLQPVDILYYFDKQQQGRIQQYYREILALKNYITQMNRLVIGENNETVWSIKYQLKVAVGERTSSKRDLIQYEELMQQYKWRVETIYYEKDSLVNLNKELESRADALHRQIYMYNETIYGYVAEFDRIHYLVQDSATDITPQQAITDLIYDRARLYKSVEEYYTTAYEDRIKLEEAERVVADLETAVYQLNFYLADARSQHLVGDYASLEKDRKIERLEGELAMLKETQDTLRTRVLQSYDEEKFKKLDEKLIGVTRRAETLERQNYELYQQLSIYYLSGESEVHAMVSYLKQQYYAALSAVTSENEKLRYRVSNMEKIGGGSEAMQSRVTQHLAELQRENELLKEQVQKGVELANKLNYQLQAKPRDSAQVKSEILLKNAQIQYLQQQLDLARYDAKDFAEKERTLRSTLQNYYMSSNQDYQLIEQYRYRIDGLFEENKIYQEKLAEQVKSNEALYGQYYELIARSNEQLLLYQSALDRSGISIGRAESKVAASMQYEILQPEDVVMSVVAGDAKVAEISQSDALTPAQPAESQPAESQASDMHLAEPASVKPEASTSEVTYKKKHKVTEKEPTVPEPVSPIVTEEDTASAPADAPKKKKKSTTAETSKTEEPEKKADELVAEPSAEKTGEKKKKKSTTTTAEVSKTEEAPKPEEPKEEASISATTGEKKKKKKSSTASAETSKADEPVPKAVSAPAPVPEASKTAETSASDGTGEKKKKKKSSTASAEISKADEPTKAAEPSDASVGVVKKKKKAE